MKILRKLSSLFLIIALGTTIVVTNSSCSKDDPVPAAKSITEIVNTDANFSLLKQAITRANLGATLSSGTFTVFAPDNAAFAASGVTSAIIDAIPVADLADLLTYHVVGARVASSGVPASDTVKTVEGSNLYASKNANGVFVNGIKVKTADVSAANGVIHVISSLLTPPSETIAEIATASPDLELLLTAVVRAGLAGAVSAPGKYTVFAPTDAAFIAAGFPDAASINAAPVATVASIVKAHIFSTNVFASDLIAGANVATLEAGKSITVGRTPAPNVKITGSANPASNIIVTTNGETFNIVATNGVIHLIDRVLL